MFPTSSQLSWSFQTRVLYNSEQLKNLVQHHITLFDTKSHGLSMKIQMRLFIINASTIKVRKHIWKSATYCYWGQKAFTHCIITLGLTTALSITFLKCLVIYYLNRFLNSPCWIYTVWNLIFLKFSSRGCHLSCWSNYRFLLKNEAIQNRSIIKTRVKKWKFTINFS